MEWYELADGLGFRVSWGTVPEGVGPEAALIDHGSCPWDGIAFHASSAVYVGDEQNEQNYWHELGHALTVPADGWAYRGWGLGMVYDGADGGPYLPVKRGTFSGVRQYGTEVDASALGIWLQYVLGRDAYGAAEHARYHDWSTGEAVGRFLMEIDPRVRNRVIERLSFLGLPHPWSA